MRFDTYIRITVVGGVSTLTPGEGRMTEARRGKLRFAMLFTGLLLVAHLLLLLVVIPGTHPGWVLIEILTSSLGLSAAVCYMFYLNSDEAKRT